MELRVSTSRTVSSVPPVSLTAHSSSSPVNLPTPGAPLSSPHHITHGVSILITYLWC